MGELPTCSRTKSLMFDFGAESHHSSEGWAVRTVLGQRLVNLRPV